MISRDIKENKYLLESGEKMGSNRITVCVPVFFSGRTEFLFFLLYFLCVGACFYACLFEAVE